MILSTHGIVSSISGVLPLLLDAYPNSSAAYSLRKLRSAYTGSAIRVRRTDLTESDIGFTSAGNLDTTALLAFTGTGALDNGFITTWYDQSGNGRNATQTTAINQPQIVSAGSVLTKAFLGGSKPTISFTTSNRLNFDTTIGKNVGDIFYKTVAYVTGGDAYRNVITISTSTGAGTSRASIFGRSSANVEAGGRRLDTDGYQFVNSTNVTQEGILGAFFNYANAQLDVYVNNTTTQKSGAFQTSGNTSNTNSATSFIGANSFGVLFAGGISEVIIYETNQSSNNTGINTNINDFYTIY
jgi:hypothetical protein